jgi:hypothetical protein
VCSQVGKRASQGPGTISGKITTGLFTPCWYLSIGQFQLSAGWRYTTTRADGEDYKKARLAVAPAGTVKKEWNILQAILNRAVMLDRIKQYLRQLPRADRGLYGMNTAYGSHFVENLRQ